MYQSSGSKVENSSFRVAAGVSRVKRTDLDALSFSSVLKLNNDCLVDLQEVLEYRESLHKQWRLSLDVKFLHEIRRVFILRKELMEKISLTSDIIFESFIEQGGILPSRRPFDTFNLRKWCVVNNYARKHFTEGACGVNVRRFQSEIDRRRRHIRRFGEEGRRLLDNSEVSPSKDSAQDATVACAACKMSGLDVIEDAWVDLPGNGRFMEDDDILVKSDYSLVEN
jgi:hypothetical protein